ncbi:MAG: hypothetical protein DME09_09685 [Candidatus Rokuibacteriota bacterium]|nr:MAG: hypothetical protein DME09_09685 [Candidatus Rokubacteria bacterium]
MVIRVSEIPDDGLSVEGADKLPEPFHDRSWRLEELPQVCGRCLERFPTRVAPAVDARFSPRPERGKEPIELGSDDLELDFYTDDSLDLAQLVETETTLALPMKPLCRTDCRGLCPTCGGNRNVVECACAGRAPDPRFAVLKDLAGRLSGP